MPAEDVIFYFDLGTRGVVYKKSIVKQVQRFVKTREKEHPGSNWGIVAFQHEEDNPRFHEGLAKDEDELEPFLKDNLKFVAKAHPLEQGLMLASTYLVDAYRTTRNHTLRMIVISDGPTEGSNVDLLNALMDLLDTIKYFPVYIDIIRIGDERVYPDDVKLRMIAEKANGKVYYAVTDESFKDIMEILLAASSTLLKRGLLPIEKRTYFEGLCWSLLETGIPGTSCKACGQGEQYGTVLQCENCGTPYHGSCATSIAQQEYEAFPGIFRCKKCDCLINTASKKIIIPATQPAKKPAQQAKVEPVRIVIKAPSEAKPVPVPPSAETQVQAPGTPGPSSTQAPVSFTVKALAPSGPSQAAKAKPPALSMKPPAPGNALSIKPPASGMPAQVKKQDASADDIEIISLDEGESAKGVEGRGGVGADGGVVILDADAEDKPATFWKKGKV
jgi:hypothetical protein